MTIYLKSSCKIHTSFPPIFLKKKGGLESRPEVVEIVSY